MPNTANYSFPTPADTDLVKNGADAIRDLGDAVDTAMNTALGTKKSGLVLLNTTSFSGVSSQSINDVFSATYDHYFLTFTLDSSAAGPEIRMRLRVSGSDNSSAQYRYQNVEGSGATVGAARNTSKTEWFIGRGSNAVRNFFNLQISNPFSSSIRTSAFGLISQSNDGNITANIVSSSIDVTTSYTGFTLIPESGTITGTVSVFGYNK